MLTPHNNRTPAQIEAIRKGVAKMASIDPHQFDMATEMLNFTGTTPDAECHTVGCIAAWVGIANDGYEVTKKQAATSILQTSADLMGLTKQEKIDLFTPDFEGADYDCKDYEEEKFINFRHAMLAFSNFYWTGEVTWDKETLDKYESQHLILARRNWKL